MSADFCGGLCLLPVMLFGMLLAWIEWQLRKATRAAGLPMDVSENWEDYIEM